MSAKQMRRQGRKQPEDEQEDVYNGEKEQQGDTYTQERCGVTGPHPSGVMCNRRKGLDEKRLCWVRTRDHE